MIISGGENVYPAEIENVLHDHPAVADCVVVGRPHPRWGESPHAFVVLVPGHTLTGADVDTFLTGRLARYKIPKGLTLMARLPRNASGKINRRALRTGPDDAAGPISDR
jgi:fatty-acyl-CoA synthase